MGFSIGRQFLCTPCADAERVNFAFLISRKTKGSELDVKDSLPHFSSYKYQMFRDGKDAFGPGPRSAVLTIHGQASHFQQPLLPRPTLPISLVSMELNIVPL
jgi:hypothetical protein